MKLCDRNFRELVCAHIIYTNTAQAASAFYREELRQRFCRDHFPVVFGRFQTLKNVQTFQTRGPDEYQQSALALETYGIQYDGFAKKALAEDALCED